LGLGIVCRNKSYCGRKRAGAETLDGLHAFSPSAGIAAASAGPGGLRTIVARAMDPGNSGENEVG
jgi:hypothetical protein